MPFLWGGDAKLIETLEKTAGVIVHRQTRPQQIAAFLHTHRCIGMALYQDTERYRMIGTNSRKLYEYVAAGAPVIASNLGEVPDFVGTGVGWILRKSDDEDELTEMLVQLYGDQGKWMAAHEACIREVERQGISWEHEWQKIANLLDVSNK